MGADGAPIRHANVRLSSRQRQMERNRQQLRLDTEIVPLFPVEVTSTTPTNAFPQTLLPRPLPSPERGHSLPQSHQEASSIPNSTSTLVNVSQYWDSPSRCAYLCRSFRAALASGRRTSGLRGTRGACGSLPSSSSSSSVSTSFSYLPIGLPGDDCPGNYLPGDAIATSLLSRRSRQGDTSYDGMSCYAQSHILFTFPTFAGHIRIHIQLLLGC